MRKPFTWIALATLLAVPGVTLRLTEFTHTPGIEAVLFGIAILGAAFLLGAAGELAELEISAGLALVAVALIAVLPEYAVDMVYAWKAADDPQRYAPLAAANMTGANRLLIGIGWSAVILIFWFKRRHRPLVLAKSHSVELTFLLLATAWAFTIFIRSFFRDGSLNFIDVVVFVSLFCGYLYFNSKSSKKEAHAITGPMAPLAQLPKLKRRLVILALFAVPAAAILLVAEPFAESLVETGEHLGIDEFILVQWLAPLASEAPEMGVALMFAFRGMGAMGLGVLVSSKVNQWTLLVGTLPLVYSINKGGISELPLDNRQNFEFLLTSAQSLFAVLLLVALRINWRGGLVLLVLFLAQFITSFVVEEAVGHEHLTTVLGTFAVVYIAASVLVLTSGTQRRALFALPPRALRQLREGAAAAVSSHG
jgi:cation:H+ antiporter